MLNLCLAGNTLINTFLNHYARLPNLLSNGATLQAQCTRYRFSQTFRTIHAREHDCARKYSYVRSPLLTTFIFFFSRCIQPGVSNGHLYDLNSYVECSVHLSITLFQQKLYTYNLIYIYYGRSHMKTRKPNQITQPIKNAYHKKHFRNLEIRISKIRNSDIFVKNIIKVFRLQKNLYK